MSVAAGLIMILLLALLSTFTEIRFVLVMPEKLRCIQICMYILAITRVLILFPDNMQCVRFC